MNDTQNVYCDLNFNQDRFNIHSRNMKANFKILENLSVILVNLLQMHSEWYDINTGKITDISNNLYFDNPHFISVMTDAGVCKKDV